MESAIQPLILAGVLALLIVFERLRPLRRTSLPIVQRWASNFGLAAISVILLRLLQPLAAATAGVFVERYGFGLFQMTSLPAGAEFILALVILDCAIYWQHVAFHHIPFLWPYHRVHHSDRELDVSTALRFHPVEIVISALFKVGVIVLLGAPLAAVVVFELLLTGFAMFNHSNLDLGREVDFLVRRFVVTPRMHWVHHSTDRVERDRNFGFCIAWWDRIFGTYQAAPARGIRGIEFGVEGFGARESGSLLMLLRQPLVRR